MEIKPYPGEQPIKLARSLFKLGVLVKYPVQKKRDDLTTFRGVDIHYYFRGMTPSTFKELVDMLLLAAYEEASRYSEAPWKFAKFTVDLNLNAKGRTEGVSETREYIAAKHPDAETMVWGKGIDLPEGVPSPFLVDKAEQILDILESESPGPYLQRKNPFKVRSMTISIREQLFKEHPKPDVAAMKERALGQLKGLEEKWAKEDAAKTEQAPTEDANKPAA